MKTIFILTISFLSITALAEDQTAHTAATAPEHPGRIFAIGAGELVSGIIGARVAIEGKFFDKDEYDKTWKRQLPEESQRLTEAQSALKDSVAREADLRKKYKESSAASQLSRDLEHWEHRLEIAQQGLTQKGLAAEDTKILHDERKVALAGVETTKNEIAAAEKNISQAGDRSALRALVTQREKEFNAAKTKFLKAPTSDMQILARRVSIKSLGREILVTRLGIAGGLSLAFDGGWRIYRDVTAPLPEVIDGHNYAPKNLGQASAGEAPEKLVDAQSAQ